MGWRFSRSCSGVILPGVSQKQLRVSLSFFIFQVHNALGFSYFSDDKVEAAVKEYQKAVKLQPGYVVAWNNLGNALEKSRDLKGALKAYQEALTYDPSNAVASARAEYLSPRVNFPTSRSR